MFYRRKILLSLLQIFGGSLDKSDFQKYLFLLNADLTSPFYEFVPNKDGCFSFQANQDMSTMVKYDLVGETRAMWILKGGTDQLSQLKPSDKILVTEFHKKFGSLRVNKLILYIAGKYPYYLIRSSDAEKILDKKDYEKVRKSDPQKKGNTLISIGYEGRTAEGFVNELIKQDVRALCDVRKNAISMKYGFSKSQLKTIAESTGIKYIHIPELGIESGKRKQIDSAHDYEILFRNYESKTLPANRDAVERLFNIFKDEKRIAVMCFEREHKACHRSRTIKYLIENYKRDLKVEYL